MIHTHLLPTHFSPEQLAGGTAIVIDILRASSTISTAIASGAEAVIPCETIEQAFELRDQFEAGSTVLGGERKGKKIEGFDLGNSPREYTKEKVAGKTVIFTTTNGTRAIHRCEQAERILIGSFLSSSGIYDELITDKRTIHLVCAGTDGVISSEDCLFAGAVLKELIEDQDDKRPIEYDDASNLCLAYYHHCVAGYEDEADEIAEAFETSKGGQNLMQLGMQADLKLCAKINSMDVIPFWDKESNQIYGLD